MPEDLADVEAVLVRAVHPAADELESGWFSTPSIAALPTPPVAHWMTRNFDGLLTSGTV